MAPTTLIGRVTLPTPRAEHAHATAALQAAHQALGVCVDVDHRGGIFDDQRITLALGRSFGAGARHTRIWPLVLAVVEDYRAKRRKSPGPLRRRPLHRVKSLPAVGPLKDVLIATLHAKGLTLRDVHGDARIRHTKDGFFAHVLVHKVRKDFRGPNIPHHSRAVVHGLTMTEEGLVDDVSTLRQLDNSGGSTRELREGSYLFPLKDLSKPGYLQAFFRRCIKPDGLLVGLDLSMLPVLSNRARHEVTQVRRWFRSRQVAGAIDFRMVSTLGGEAREAFERLERLGDPVADAQAALTSVLANCPECGCLVHAKLSPTTGAPVGAACPCSARRQSGDFMGRLLARRAAVHALDGRRQAITREHYDPRSWAKSSSTAAVNAAKD